MGNFYKKILKNEVKIIKIILLTIVFISAYFLLNKYAIKGSNIIRGAILLIMFLFSVVCILKTEEFISEYFYVYFLTILGFILFFSSI